MRHNIQYIFPIDVIKNVFLKCRRQSVGNHVLNNGSVAGSNSPQDFGPGAERFCGMLWASPSHSSLGEKVEAGGEEWWSSAEKYFTEWNQIWVAGLAPGLQNRNISTCRCRKILRGSGALCALHLAGCAPNLSFLF